MSNTGEQGESDQNDSLFEAFTKISTLSELIKLLQSENFKSKNYEHEYFFNTSKIIGRLINSESDIGKIAECLVILEIYDVVSKIVYYIDTTLLLSKLEKEQDIEKLSGFLGIMDSLNIMYYIEHYATYLLHKMDLSALITKINNEQDIEKISSCINTCTRFSYFKRTIYPSISPSPNFVIKLLDELDRSKLLTNFNEEKNLIKIKKALEFLEGIEFPDGYPDEFYEREDIDLHEEILENMDRKLLEKKLKREKSPDVLLKYRSAFGLPKPFPRDPGDDMTGAAEMEGKKIVILESKESSLISALLTGAIEVSDFRLSICHFSKTNVIDLFCNSFPKFSSGVKTKITDTFTRYFFSNDKIDTNEFWRFVDFRDFWPELRKFHDVIYSRNMTLSDVIKFFEQTLFQTKSRLNLNFLEKKIIDRLGKNPSSLYKQLAEDLGISEKKVSVTLKNLNSRGIYLGGLISYESIGLHEFFLF